MSLNNHNSFHHIPFKHRRLSCTRLCLHSASQTRSLLSHQGPDHHFHSPSQYRWCLCQAYLQFPGSCLHIDPSNDRFILFYFTFLLLIANVIGMTWFSCRAWLQYYGACLVFICSNNPHCSFGVPYILNDRSILLHFPPPAWDYYCNGFDFQLSSFLLAKTKLSAVW